MHDPDPGNGELLTRDVLAAEIARRLALDIITLEILPQARLIEEDIGRRFGISRSPVREAMRILEADGLIHRSPRRGSVVAPMSRADLEAIYACRLALEPLASAGVARNASRAVRAELRAAWAAMRRARQRRDARAAFLANMGLTDALHAHSGNPVLNRLLASVDKQGLRYRFVAYRDIASFLAKSLDENAALLAAIDAGDAVAAAATTERLILAALDSLRPLFPAEDGA